MKSSPFEIMDKTRVWISAGIFHSKFIDMLRSANNSVRYKKPAFAI